MSEINYKPNSHKSREEASEKRVEKVVQGPVKVKKKSEIQKFAEVFISEDAANVKSYILMDVLVPTVKKTILDIVDMILFGGNGRSGKRSTADRVSYNRYYDRRDDDRYSSNRTRSGYNYDDIIMETRTEAEHVRDRLDEIMDQYGLVRVADLYDLVGITGSYTDNDYGWTNIRNAEIIRVREGYMLKMPRAIPIK